VLVTRAPSAAILAPADTDPGYRDLRRGLLSAAIGLATYFGARGLGASPIDALLLSTAVSAGRAAYVAIKERRFDPIAAFLATANLVTLAFGLGTQSPVVVMFGQHLPGVVFLAFVLGSLVMRRPMTESIVNWLRPQWIHQHATSPTWGAEEAAGYRRTHMYLTSAIAGVQTLHLVAASIVILTLSVDVANGMLGVFAMVTDIAALGITIGGASRSLRRRHA
jgi:hypothetical protein